MNRYPNRMKPLTALKIIWRENSLFFYLLTTLLLIGAFPLFMWDQVSFFIWLKQWHHPIADYIAPYLTWLGDGVVYLCLLGVMVIFRVKCRKMVIMGGSFITMSIVVQLLKRVICTHRLRPIALVDASLHLVDGVPLLRDLSFPSGHAATIFVWIVVIQLFTKSQIYSLFLLGLALMVAYSRIYLCQHFYTDVYVGAWIGTVSTVAVYIGAVHWNGPKWLDRSLYRLLIYKWRRLTH